VSACASPRRTRRRPRGGAWRRSTRPGRQESGRSSRVPAGGRVGLRADLSLLLSSRTCDSVRASCCDRSSRHQAGPGVGVAAGTEKAGAEEAGEKARSLQITFAGSGSRSRSRSEGPMPAGGAPCSTFSVPRGNFVARVAELADRTGESAFRRTRDALRTVAVSAPRRRRTPRSGLAYEERSRESRPRACARLAPFRLERKPRLHKPCTSRDARRPQGTARPPERPRALRR
jgi:hypothetical protein